MRTTSAVAARQTIASTLATLGTPSLEYWGGFQRTNDFDYSFPWLIWINRSGSAIRSELKFTTSVATMPGTSFAPEPSSVLFGIERFDDSARFRVAGTIFDELANAGMPLTVPLQIRLANQSTTTVLRFGMVRVRKAARIVPFGRMGPTEAL